MRWPYPDHSRLGPGHDAGRSRRIRLCGADAASAAYATSAAAGLGRRRRQRTASHVELDAANADVVAGLQDCPADAVAVDVDAVEAVEVDDLPAGVGIHEAAMSTADVRQRHAQVGSTVPAEQQSGWVRSIA